MFGYRLATVIQIKKKSSSKCFFVSSLYPAKDRLCSSILCQFLFELMMQIYLDAVLCVNYSYLFYDSM